MIPTSQEVHSKTAKVAKRNGEGELAKVRDSFQIKHHWFPQAGEHLLRASQGQLHPNDSREHEFELCKLVAQVNGVERAEQLRVVDGEKEDGVGEAQGETAKAKVAKQNKVK